MPLISMVVFFILIVPPSLLVFAPFIGMATGAEHIRQNVIVPRSCAPLKTRAIRLQKKTSLTKSTEYFVTCVSVSSDRRLLGRGRVAFSTSSAIILYDPASGAVVRVPTKDAVIEIIDHL